MNKTFKRLLGTVLSLSLAGSYLAVPMAQAEEYTPLVAGDTVVEEWKFDFGSADNVMEGYTAVTPDVNVVATGDYGFIGNDGNGYRFTDKYDSYRYQEGQTMNLVVGGSGENDAIGIQRDDTAVYPQYTTGEYYPVSFGLYVDNGSYYRVRATVTTLDPTLPAKASLYYERRHPVFNQKEIAAGETVTVDFSVDVETINFKNEGNFVDDMLNISLLGDNAALSSLIIQKIDESASPATTLWVLGDSTVTDGSASIPYFDLQNYTGVGAYLSKYVPSTVAVSNQGEGGLNAADSSHFAIARDNIKAGDYMYVQYGHNHKTGGPIEYYNCLDKYYDACEAVGATLIIVGPIDRHNESQYDSSTNTWSSTLGNFSTVGKGYVDSMLYGGKEAADEYGRLLSSETELEAGIAAAEAYLATLKQGEKAGVENIGFVDLNAPTLEWLESLTEETRDRAMTNYYFTTSKNGATDGTHPNDAGADALAYRFFTNANAEEYPVLAPLLTNFAEGATHEVDVPVSDDIIAAGAAGKSDYWPVYPSPVDYDFGAQIKSPKFDENGVITSVDVTILDSGMLNGYSRAYFAVYNTETGALENLAVSENYVDNTQTGTQTLTFDTDVAPSETQTYKIYLWEFMDDAENGYPTTMIPAANVYVPTGIESYIITGEETDVENFDYYSATTLDETDWDFGGSAGHDLTLGEDENGVTYARIMSDGAKNGSAGQGSFYIMRELENLTDDEGTNIGTGYSGRYMIEVDINYTTGGGLNFGFAKNTTPNKSPFISEGFTAFTVADNGVVMVGDTEVGQLAGGTWTNVQYILNMDSGKATISVAGGTPVEVDVPEYQTTSTPAPDTLKHFVMEGQKVAFDMNITNLTVAKLANEKAVNCTVSASIPEEQAEMGTVSVNGGGESVSAAQGSTVTLTAVPNEGCVFTGWQLDGEAYSSDTEITVRVVKDLEFTATFASQGGVEDVASFDVSADKTKMAAGTEQTITFTVSNVCDESGNEVVYSPSDVTWTCDDSAITVENGVAVIPADYTGSSFKNVIPVKCTINNVERTVNLVVYSSDYYEDFSEITDFSTWISNTGTTNSLFAIINSAEDADFVGMKAAGNGNALVMGNNSNGTGKMFAYDRDMGLSEHTVLNFGFDIEAYQIRKDGKDAGVNLQFVDTEGTKVFDIAVNTGGKDSSFNGTVVSGFKQGTVVSVDTVLDFVNKTMTYTLTNSDGTVLASGTSALEAANLARMSFSGEWQYGKFAIDNIYAEYTNAYTDNAE